MAIEDTGWIGAATSAPSKVNTKLTKVDLLSDLKALIPTAGDKVYLVGKDAMGDGRGGFYYWDATATGSEDTTYMNVIPANAGGTGRWIRAFQRARSYPMGVMVINGGVKTLYVTTISTDANGDATAYLTDDGTATGNALFTEIWFHDVRANVSSSTPSTGVSSYFKSLSVNLKTLIYGNFRPNPVTITLGLVYAPVSAVPAGVTVLFKVEGI